MNINGIELSDEELLEHTQKFIGIFTLGEVLDKIECGMYAISSAGPDRGMLIGADKYGRVYCVDKISSTNLGDVKSNLEVKFDHYFKKVSESEAPLKRWILINHGKDELIYSEGNGTQSV